MISFWRIFWLELIAAWRSWTWLGLLVVSAAWMLVSPRVLTADGTLEGARELYIHYSLGGVFALLVIALLASGTSSLASERVAKRLQLTLIRPVRYAAIVLAKALALLTVGVSVLTLSCAILYCKSPSASPCYHVLSPIMESPRTEAERMYETYLKDPATPERIRQAKKSTVVRILTQKAVDRYQTIPTNAVAKWQFESPSANQELQVRMRFTNAFEMRQAVRGVFTFAGAKTIVSNLTQAVVTMPLNCGQSQAGELSFFNTGDKPLMLRPRGDLHLLAPADGFGANLVRAGLKLTAILGLIIMFGLFLSAGLGRPVALFVAMATLLVGEMSPSVVEQYPDELGAGLVDRVGLYITRFATEVTRPIASASPLMALARNECIEPRSVLRLVAIDLVGLPLLLALIAGWILPRKTED